MVGGGELEIGNDNNKRKRKRNRKKIKKKIKRNNEERSARAILYKSVRNTQARDSKITAITIHHDDDEDDCSDIQLHALLLLLSDADARDGDKGQRPRHLVAALTRKNRAVHSGEHAMDDGACQFVVDLRLRRGRRKCPVEAEIAGRVVSECQGNAGGRGVARDGGPKARG